MNKGLLFVVSGPSGVGKGTVLGQLVDENENIHYSVSATTRAPREGEVDAVNYHFLSRDDFEKKINNGEMLEYAVYNNNYYGTPKDAVDRALTQGSDVILEIEVEGAFSIKKMDIGAVFIFVMPPSMEVLEDRLRKRGTNNEEDIANRLSIARAEIDAATAYDYIVINDDIKSAKEKIQAIIFAEHSKCVHMQEYYNNNF